MLNSQRHIAHFIDSYPFLQFKYIYDQIADFEDKKSVMVSERFLGGQVPDNLYFFRSSSVNPWVDRLDRFVTARFAFFNNLYSKSLDKFYRGALRNLNPVLLHAHFGMYGCKLSRIKKDFNIPLVVTFYGNDASYCLKNDAWLKKYAVMFEAADRFIVLCNEAKKRLLAHGCPEEKICLWNIGLDLENYPCRIRNSSGRIKFLTVARFVEAKGYPFLFEAFSKLRKTQKNIHLTVVGFGPLKNYLLKIVDKLNIRDYVTLIDTTGLKDFYRFFRDILFAHDVFILPSTTSKEGEDEAGPALSMIYAQSSGMPVVCTPFPGAEISVIDEVTGLISKQDDADSLKDKMGRLAENEFIRDDLGLKASALVNREFSLIRQNTKLHEIYRQVLS